MILLLTLSIACWIIKKKNFHFVSSSPLKEKVKLSMTISQAVDLCQYASVNA